MTIAIIAGARPNFMKIAPIIAAIEKSLTGMKYRLIHTGQHYDQKMSASFFEDLNIPAPQVNLECGGGSQAEQTAAIMLAFEKELLAHPADYVLVVGDVTSTLACSIVAKKLNTKVIHVEAGIRSGDRSMPEEINRLVTDSITDLFFTTTPEAGANLIANGVAPEQIHWVGNVMIDTLRANEARFRQPDFWQEQGLQAGKYWVMTLHRPANVDEGQKLQAFIDAIAEGAGDWPVIFPIHPRTEKVFVAQGISLSNIITVDPLGYLDFNYLVKHSGGVITDSGGITEETTVMGIPCLTLRDNTERPETVVMGTNELIGTDPVKLLPAMAKIRAGQWKQGEIPEKWDGKAAERLVKILSSLDAN